MKEHPILFSTPMVQAILNGSKTQTRRIVKNVPDDIKGEITWGYSAFTPKGYISLRTKFKTDTGHNYGEKFFKLPYGGKEGIVWVRENFKVQQVNEIWAEQKMAHVCIDFVASEGGKTNDFRKWFYFPEKDKPKVLRRRHPEKVFISPSIFLPKQCARIKLEIINIKVERLQDISEEEAKAEGVEPFQKDLEGDCWTDGKFKTAYEYLWNIINGWMPNSWAANPWVWVIEFKKV